MTEKNIPIVPEADFPPQEDILNNEPVFHIPHGPANIDIPMDDSTQSKELPHFFAPEEAVEDPDLFLFQQPERNTATMPELVLPNHDDTSASENTRVKGKRRRSRRDIRVIVNRWVLRVVLVLLVTVSLVIGAAYVLLDSIFNGPYPAACEKLTMSLAKSSGTWWIPAFFMGEERAAQIMAGDETLVEPPEISGKVEIDSDNVFLLLNCYETRSKEESKAEAHRKYIDVMYMVEGTEVVYVKPVHRLQKVTREYDTQIDALLAEIDEDSSEIRLMPGDFLILFPEDAHAPACSVDQSVHVKKIIGKVKIDL